MPPVEQSDGAGSNNKKRGIFSVDGASVVFSFHKSVTEGARDVLFTKIEENGGEMTDEEEGADVLLYDPKRTNAALLRTGYGAHSNHKLRDLWLIPVSHIKHSIQKRSFELLSPRRQAMPGPGTGRQRVEFSQEDKENLAKYLACRVPVPAQGGLQGKILYKELVKLHQVDPKEYEWVKRHSWQSWRDQYKHNQAYYHALIADFVSQSPNHDRHRYFRTRELNRGVKRSHSDDEEDVEDNNSGHIPTRNWRGKRAAREEERRQESIARRQEDEEDSEEDDASSHDRPKNATPGPSRSSATIVASPEKTQIIQSQTPPGSPVQMHFSPEPRQEQSPPRLPVVETIDIESEPETLPRPKPKLTATRAKTVVIQIPIRVNKEEITSPTLGPKELRAKTPEPIVIDLEKTKTATPEEKEDPIVVELEAPPRPTPKSKANEKSRAKTLEPTIVESEKTRTPTPGEEVAAESEPEEQPKPKPTVKGKARSTRTPARKSRTPDVAPTAPYRNTRSRSRSVEPVELPPTKRRRINKKPDLKVVEEQENEEMIEVPVEPVVQPEPKKRRGNKKQVLKAVEEPKDEEEDKDEPVVHPEIKEQSVDPVMERPDDEQDEEEKIEDLLRSEDPNNFISDAARPRKSQPSFTDFEPDDVGPQMYDTMDEDDLQTRAALFSGDEDDEDDDEQVQGPLFTQDDDIQIEVAETQEKPPSTQPLSHALTRFNNRRTKQVAPPVTPARQVRVRRDSTESSEHFPLKDTGAGRKLKEMHNIGKVAPYVPPSGSRAAKHLLERSP